MNKFCLKERFELMMCWLCITVFISKARNRQRSWVHESCAANCEMKVSRQNHESGWPNSTSSIPQICNRILENYLDLTVRKLPLYIQYYKKRIKKKAESAYHCILAQLKDNTQVIKSRK